MYPKILTFDLEEWYHANYDSFDYSEIKNPVVRLNKLIPAILEMLAKTGSKATFFVLGEVALKHPDLVKSIFEAGHEIASHSHHHWLLNKLSVRELKDEIVNSKEILEDLIGAPVHGFRAPCFSVDLSMYANFIGTLKYAGYKYDSSIITDRFYTDEDIIKRYQPHKIHGITECPVASGKLLGQKFPISGGYFRFLPNNIVRKMIDRYAQLGPVVLYFHPKDLDCKNPKLPLPWRYNVLHRYGIKKSEKRLVEILNEYTFISFEDYFNNRDEQNISNNMEHKELQIV